MATLSLCMIVKNEEDVLARCLSSVKRATDEIIVVDTGSLDKTKEIALSEGAKVYDYKWSDDFSAARNYAFSLASADYIMWLDADDVVEECDLEKLISLKKRLTKDVKQVAAKYNVAFDEDGNATFSYYRERIFLRDAGFEWRGAVHEIIPLEANCLYADFCVSHLKEKPTASDRNLKIYEKQIAAGHRLNQRELYYYARELFYNYRTDDAIKTFECFLENDAWVEDKIGALLMLSKCFDRQKNPERALNCLFNTFSLDLPRAEVCCEIGRLYLNSADYIKAVYWYQSAIRENPDGDRLSFSNSDCRAFIPFLQLCVCYDKLQQYDLAELYNNQAELIKPNNNAVLQNKEYFKRRNNN